MPINPLALQVQMPDLQSPINSMAKGATLQNIMLKQQQVRDEMEQARRDRLLDTAIQQHLASGGNIDDLPKLFGQKGIAVAKSLIDNENARATGMETRGNVLDKELTRSRRLLDTVTTPEGYLAWHDANHTNPVIGPWLQSMGIDTRGTRAQIETELGQPGGLERLLAKSSMGLDKFLTENKPSYNELDLGNVKVTEARPGLGMEPPKVAGVYDVGMSPYQEADLAFRNRQEARLGAEQTRASERPVLTRVVDPNNPAQMIEIDVPRYEGGSVGAPGVIGISGKTPGTPEALDVKEQSKRDAAYPKVTAAYRAATNEIDTLITDLTKLRNHPGLSASVGGIEGRLPSVRGKTTEFDAKLDKILSRGQFRELQNMRANSPTGGALGNVSDAENRALRSAFAALDKRQGEDAFRLAVDDAIYQLQTSKQNVAQAYDDTYAYRSSGTIRGQQDAAPAGSAPPGVDPEDWAAMTPEERALWP